MKENIEIKLKDIVAHGGSQTNAFEELCTQLARNTISNNEKFDRFHVLFSQFQAIGANPGATSQEI